MVGGDAAELGEIEGLERFWLHMTGRRRRRAPRDRIADRILLDALGLGIEQTSSYLSRTAPDFATFRAWIAATAGQPEPERIERYHAWLDGAPPPASTRARLRATEEASPVLCEADLDHWQREGYVILRAAIAADEARAAADALWRHLGASPDDPDGWYAFDHPGIMVQIFQHSAMEPARRSARVHKAFAQLLGTADLWTTTDRMSFNPPETPSHPFQGPRLHWDVSLTTPIPLATQAILYLTDTAADQGAFTLVPGFHRRIQAWLESLPPGTDPRQTDLSAEARPIAAGAGDLIIWHQALPHGASPNRSSRPRLAQYVNMYSPEEERQCVWR